MEACCIGNSCLKQTSFRALVDSGSSFTYLPNKVYKRITEEVTLNLYDLILICVCLTVVIHHSFTVKSRLQDLALKVIHGSTAISPGETA